MKKAKGPFRTGVVVPFVLFVLIFWAYFFFFFDTHLKHALEHFGTEANGAEIDIANVRTSFWNASLEINQVQVTDGKTPMKNKIEITRMHWKMLWDALLRAKVVIDDASIEGIALGTPRKSAGKVLPPPPPPKEGPSATDKALDRVQAEFKDNVLGDAASLLKGADPAAQLKNLTGNLKSQARIEEMQKQFGDKQKEWNDRIAKLPTQKDLASIQDRVKHVKLDHFNGPADIQNSLSQISSIYNDANAKVTQVQETKTALDTDINTYQNSIGDLNKLVAADVKDLEQHIKLPHLDAATLTRALFGPAALEKLQQARYYIAKARSYMPPKKKEQVKTADELVPHAREKGQDYSFPKPRSYPLFWLKRAALSSKAVPGADLSGNLTGALTNVTTDQQLAGEATELTFKGDFPAQKIDGVDGLLSFDHRSETPIEKIALKVASLPIPDRALIESPDVTVGLKNAIGHVTLTGEFSGDVIKVASENTFTGNGPIIATEAHEALLAEILKGAAGSVPKVTLNTGIHGKWDAPEFDLDSSLGRDLAQGFSKQLDAKVAEARAKLNNLVNDQIGKQKAALTAQFDQQKSQIDKILQGRLDDVNKTKGMLDQAKNDVLKNQGKQLQDQGKKAADQLKKSLGF